MRSSLIIAHEWRAIAAQGYVLRAIPLCLFVPLLALWPEIGTPFAPAAIAAVLLAEPTLNNTFALWPTLLPAYAVTPAPWQRIIVAKNVAALAVLVAGFFGFGSLAAFVSVEPPASADWGGAALYLWTVLFPLVILGNSASLHHPRVRSGWTLDDAAAAILIVFALSFLSLPFFLLEGWSGGRVILGLYGAAAGLLWRYRSVVTTARRVHNHLTSLWPTLQTSSS